MFLKHFNSFTILPPEDEEELPEDQGVVQILIHFLDHGLQSKVGLGSPQLLHHVLQWQWQVQEQIKGVGGVKGEKRGREAGIGF